MNKDTKPVAYFHIGQQVWVALASTGGSIPNGIYQTSISGICLLDKPFHTYTGSETRVWYFLDNNNLGNPCEADVFPLGGAERAWERLDEIIAACETIRENVLRKFNDAEATRTSKPKPGRWSSFKTALRARL